MFDCITMYKYCTTTIVKESMKWRGGQNVKCHYVKKKKKSLCQFLKHSILMVNHFVKNVSYSLTNPLSPFFYPSTLMGPLFLITFMVLDEVIFDKLNWIWIESELVFYFIFANFKLFWIGRLCIAQRTKSQIVFSFFIIIFFFC